MTKLYRIALLLCLFISPVAFAQNMTVLGHLNYTQDLNDIWGHEDTTGVEYALVGVRNGFSIVSLANPSNPTEIQFIPGPSSTFGNRNMYPNTHSIFEMKHSSSQIWISINFI